MTIHTQEKLSKIRSSFCSQCLMQCKMSFVSVAILAQTMTVCEFDLCFWLGNITLPSVPNTYKTIQGATQTRGCHERMWVQFSLSCPRHTGEQCRISLSYLSIQLILSRTLFSSLVPSTSFPLDDSLNLS